MRPELNHSSNGCRTSFRHSIRAARHQCLRLAGSAAKLGRGRFGDGKISVLRGASAETRPVLLAKQRGVETVVLPCCCDTRCDATLFSKRLGKRRSHPPMVTDRPPHHVSTVSCATTVVRVRRALGEEDRMDGRKTFQTQCNSRQRSSASTMFRVLHTRSWK